MSQNANLEARRKDFRMVHMDDNLKNELRKSHFLFGNFNTNYNSAFQSDYQQKKSVGNFDKNYENVNKKVSHKMGSDKVAYMSESHNKFISPSEMNKTLGGFG